MEHWKRYWWINIRKNQKNLVVILNYRQRNARNHFNWFQYRIWRSVLVLLDHISLLWPPILVHSSNVTLYLKIVILLNKIWDICLICIFRRNCQNVQQNYTIYVEITTYNSMILWIHQYQMSSNYYLLKLKTTQSWYVKQVSLTLRARRVHFLVVLLNIVLIRNRR